MIYTPDDVFIDHESFSEAELKKVGSYAYAEHSSTEILLTTYAFGDEPVEAYDATAGGKIPAELRDLLRYLQRKPGKKGNPKLIGANYLLFDRLLLRNCWGFEIDPRDIIDTMVCAFRHSLPGSLAMQCEVLQIAEENAKDKRGKALIQRFCKPTPKNYKIRRYDANTHPEEWKAFINYAKSDITSMREVFQALPDWGNIEFENTVLAVDQRINDRGFFVDTALANAAIEAVKRHKVELQAEANQKYGAGLTGAAFLPTLRDLAPAHEILNAQKSTLNDLLADDELPDEARAIIEMRLGASSTASTKYNPLLLGLSADGRRRGCLQYGGAKRTLRWAGKGFQPQNLARGYFSDYDNDGNYTGELTDGINMLLRGNAHWLYDVSRLTASTVRGCIVPTDGNKLVVADYSNVEGRGLAWAAGETTALDTFAAGLDIYCVTAGKMFGMEPDVIKKTRKDLRQIGKACELGLGYGGGVAAFLTFAKNLGLNLYEMAEVMKGTFPEHIWAAAKRGYEYARIQEKNKRGFNDQKPDRPSYDLPKNVWLTCDSIKRMWRESHPATCQFWSDLEAAAMNAIKDPGTDYWAGAAVRKNGDRAIKITRTGSARKPGWWLKVELPSGRILSYPGIGISVEKSVEEDSDRIDYRERIRYMGENQTTRQWGKQYTYGGKLAENITQALCRDLLAVALVRVDAADGWDIILHIHDEVVCETPDTEEYSVAKLESMMCELPSWAKGFPLVAEGQELKRYAK